MADFLIIGALSMDRPIWLDGPLWPGVRLRARSKGGRLEGRLGGGGANAGVALARAGHQVALASAVVEGADGDAVLAEAQAAGLDTRRIWRREEPAGTTWILIDPAGERVILGLDGDLKVSTVMPPPGPTDRFDGLFIRTAYPQASQWAQTCDGPVLAHWPSATFQGLCDVLVTSADDWAADSQDDPFAMAQARVGSRLRWLVVTHGGGDVVAYGAEGTIQVSPPPAPVVDATGAGDVFAAGLLEALVGGVDMESALRHACVWGAEAVGLDSSAPLAGRFSPITPTAV